MIHLTEENICAWIAGVREPECAHHVEQCAACKSELEAFAGFQSTAHAWSALTEAETRAPMAIRKLSGPRLALYGAAFATLCFTLMFLLPSHAPVSDDIAANTAAKTAADDALLLQRIQTQVYRTHPDAMDPLAKLMRAPSENHKKTEQ